MTHTTLFYGSVVHSLDIDTLEYLLRAVICVQDGKIAWIEKDVESSSLLQQIAARHNLDITSSAGGDDVTVVELEEGQFLCPGLIDTHTHAPQYPNLGLGGQYQLLDWLENLTFPREGMFGDLEYARGVYTEVVKRNLSVGTTTCCYYGSIHKESTLALAEIVVEQGQRALVGKCNMDRNSAPTCTEASAEQSVEETAQLVQAIRELPGDNLVQPCVTPRFAISCTDDLLAGLGRLCADDPKLAIQTHISENALENDQTRELFPQCETYAGVYDSFGLLREGTILAHAVHLSLEELDLIKSRGAGISHCPTSNMNLQSGAGKVVDMLDRGIKVGLGSDCSGGYAIGVLAQLRNAASLSKLIALDRGKGGKALSIPTLFHMATLGGASLCRLEDVTGNFLPDKEFDALIIRPGTSPGFFTADTGVPPEKRRKWDESKLREHFERTLFLADDRDLMDVYVRGRRVAGSRKV